MAEARLEISGWSGISRGLDEDGQWEDVNIRGRIRLSDGSGGWSLVGIESLSGTAAISYISP